MCIVSENLIAVLLGIVEGLTEFIPVSSTGHMIIVGHMIGFEGNLAKIFDVVIQLGAILAVLVLYKERFARFLTKEGWQAGQRPYRLAYCRRLRSHHGFCLSGPLLHQEVSVFSGYSGGRLGTGGFPDDLCRTPDQRP